MHAFALLHLGQTGEASRALTRAQGRPEASLPELETIGHALTAAIARLDCDLTAARYNLEVTRREITHAVHGKSSISALTCAAAANAAAGTLLWHGDLPAAHQLLRRTQAHPASQQTLRMRVSGLSLTALLYALTGQLHKADALAACTLSIAHAAGLTGEFHATPALLATAVTALHRDDRARARQQAAEVAGRARLHADRGPFLAACILLARLSAVRGDLPAAWAVLAETSTAFPGWQPPLALHASIAAQKARLHLLGGDTATARSISRELHNLPQNSLPVSLATQTSIMRAEGDNTASAALFNTAFHAACHHGYLPYAIEALTEAAAASHTAGHLATATASLGQALTLACSETITAPFIGQAAAVRPLLLYMEQDPGRHPALRFREHLLTLMGIPAGPATSPPSTASPPSALTGRERTVLRLLHGTLTNAEIAATLNISPNTLKTHIRHLYRKLGATTREQAIAQAREPAQDR